MRSLDGMFSFKGSVGGTVNNAMHIAKDQTGVLCIWSTSTLDSLLQVICCDYVGTSGCVVCVMRCCMYMQPH